MGKKQMSNQVVFIQAYIKKLNDYIDNYNPNKLIIDIYGKTQTIDDLIDEIQSVFVGDYPEINNILAYYSGNTSLQDARKLKSFLEYQVSKISENTNQTSDNNIVSKSPVIFLSHKSNDSKYADMLRDFIIGLGVKNNQLIYTSHALHKIPMDKNIYDYLRMNINSKIFMIILWFNDYLESPACLNEMGAAWVTQSDYTNIYVPTFDFGNPKYHECAVDTRKMGAVLNGNTHCKASLIELKNKILSLFELKDDEQNSAYLIDEMMKKLSEEN